jgi:CcmD family protein
MKLIIRTIVLLLLLAAPAFAQQPAPKTPPAAAQDGFVPVDAPMNPQDTIPAPRLVAIAYGFIWVVLFGYVWSVRSRLGRVEREMEVVSRRIRTAGK